MNIFQLWLASGAIIVALLSYHVPMAWLWIFSGAASFVASTAYARYGLPLPPLFTALCDAAICLAIYRFASQAWELKLYRIFQLSVLVSMAFLVMEFWGESKASHYWYVTLLELINWAALALIFATASTQRATANEDLDYRSAGRFVRWSKRTLLSPATTHHWWRS